MRDRRRVVAGLLLVLGAVGCRPSDVGPSGEAERVNVAAAAGLQDAVALEIQERLASGQDFAEPGVRIEDEDLVREIVSALDIDLPLQARARCVERYRLRFLLRDGAVRELLYHCADEVAFLRGDQEFWQFMDVHPPQRFRQLIADQLSPAEQ
ncbi:MAG TPA: hypothetical protein VJ123_01250 [Anaerolineales bacterium]|nr:hypothetical protein [Anaerolineales bacterium]